MKKQIISLSLFVTAVALIVTSCKKDNSIENLPNSSSLIIKNNQYPHYRQLTRQEKFDIAYADWLAGVCSAGETGPLSFGIAGVASYLYYRQNFVYNSISSSIDSIPESPSDSLGYYHNIICRHLIDKDYDSVSYPEMLDEVEAIRAGQYSYNENTYNTIINTALINGSYSSDSHQHDKYLVSSFGLSTEQVTIFNNKLAAVSASNSNDQFYSNFIALKATVEQFDIQGEKKSLLLGTLSILKYSFYFWGIVD